MALGGVSSPVRNSGQNAVRVPYFWSDGGTIRVVESPVLGGFACSTGVADYVALELRRRLAVRCQDSIFRSSQASLSFTTGYSHDLAPCTQSLSPLILPLARTEF